MDNSLSKGNKISAVVSAVWLIIVFALLFNDNNGNFDEDFISPLLIIGVLPVAILLGYRWIKTPSK